MDNFKKYPFILILFSGLILMPGCKKFLNPDQELNITEDKLFDDWYEYRSVEMGMYGLQQKLVEQLMVLGELRGDLLTITPNADADLRDVYYFNISKSNRYASPTNFFKLISACNNFIRVLKRDHPEVLDPESPVTNYDKLYGEALAMRAWAYFNAVRIYEKVPYIPESLVTIDEIGNFVNSPGSYVDSVYIDYSVDGYYNDTIYNKPVTLEKNLYDTQEIVDLFIAQLESSVKAIGVNHYIDNNDASWEVTIWNQFALDALLGQMSLTRGDLARAYNYFNMIMLNPEAQAASDDNNNRYQLDATFAFGAWTGIFYNIDNREDIYTIWFNKANFQQNNFQSLFEPTTSHKYQLKPSGPAIFKWETVWRGQSIDEDLAHPSESEMREVGIPSDFYRGFGASYLYIKGMGILDPNDYMKMLELKMHGDNRGVEAIMDGVDTMVYKYSIGKGTFDNDANYIIYRAAGIHLYMAEALTYMAYEQTSGLISPKPQKAIDIVNNGAYFAINQDRPQLGVRGRVGLGSSNDGIQIGNIHYFHDPFTNEITGYEDLTGNLLAKQKLLEEQIMDEKARELAFEGERFYDLMRVSLRREDPTFLAKAVSDKFPENERAQMFGWLSNPYNWYIHYFE